MTSRNLRSVRNLSPRVIGVDMYTGSWAGRLCVPILAALIGGSAAGCTNAKYIATSTGGPTDIKFLYVDQYGDQGVIKCDRTDDGELSNCRRMRVVLKD